MIAQTVNERDRTSGRRPAFDRRNAALGTICLVLYVDLTMALTELLRTVTGKSWFFVSLVVAFLLVSLLYGKLEEWFGLEPAPPQTQPPGAE
jgi:hypothetical protein